MSDNKEWNWSKLDIKLHCRTNKVRFIIRAIQLLEDEGFIDRLEYT